MIYLSIIYSTIFTDYLYIYYLWVTAMDISTGLVFVVDSGDVRRLNEVKKELFGLCQQEKLLGATLLIFANKCDLTNALSDVDIGRILGIEELAGQRHVAIFKCSAMTGEGIAEGIEWLVQDIAQRIYLMQ